MTVLSTSSSSFISHLHSHSQRRIFNPCAHNILNNNKLSSAIAINNNSYSRKSSTISAAASSYSEGVANANQYRIKEGIPLFKPQSFQEIINNAAKSLLTAVDDGKTRLEIEFPPLPLSISQYKGSSDEFIDANIQLALALARKLNEERKMTSCIVFPDKPEKRRASRLFRSALDLVDGISLGSLDEIKGDAVQQFFSSLKSALDFDFEAANEDKWDSTKEASLYIFINSSTRELDEIEQYVDTFARETPALLFNLELDTLRSDLGLFGFPTKEVQYRFLSKFLPVYYIRTRDYSKTVPEPPFLLNYSGALFRQYPGPWQVMLKQTDGSYACVAESDKRFTLGQTKDELLRVLGIKEEEGSNLEFLRSGYKTATWWEEDKTLEEFSEWRN